MKRGYTRLEYKQKIRRLRAVRPDISLSSDFIVGFPGETEADFQQTLELIADVGFDQSFSFIYSKRPGTPAAALPGEVPHEVKQQRLEALQAQLNRQARRDPRQLAGRTENMRWVNFDGPHSLVDRFADVRITEAMPNSLRGRLVA
jgi:tRNA-2-methylthio-N6-dimethylallyladenosine synthase